MRRETLAGFTIIEVIVSIGVLLLISSLLIFVIDNKSLGTLESDAQIIVARIKEAQSRSISGIDASGWGIYFDNSGSSPTYALFKGASYSSAIQTFYLSSAVQFGTPASGATSSVAFTKLTGRVSAGTSTIVVQLITSTSTLKTITVTPQGKITLE